MKFIEKIYNPDNLIDDDITETTTRARGIIINSQAEILLCYSNGLSHYEFPGGHLEENETLLEGLKREVLEETGIELENKEKNILYLEMQNYNVSCNGKIYIYKNTENERLIEFCITLPFPDGGYSLLLVR